MTVELPIGNGLPQYQPQDPATRKRGRYWSRVSRPSQRILLMDAGRPETSTGDFRFTGPDRPYSADIRWNGATNAMIGQYFFGVALTNRHNEGVNALYLDGHVRSIPDIYMPNDVFYGTSWHRNAPFAWTDHDDPDKVY